MPHLIEALKYEYNHHDPQIILERNDNSDSNCQIRNKFTFINPENNINIEIHS